MRTPITSNPAAFKRFSDTARAPGDYRANHTAALAYLQLSPHEATADEVYQAGGGDEPTAVRNGAGKLQTMGDLFLSTIRTSYPRFIPEYLVEGGSRRFDGRPPVPLTKLADDWRAAHQVRHLDAFESFERAIAAIVKADVLVDRTDISAELAAYVTTHATPEEIRHFVWLATPKAKVA